MRLTPSDSVEAANEGTCTLVVADWKVDPHAVVAACAAHAGEAPVALLVPSRLHGIDWVGDPYANVPCARRALSAMTSLLKAASLPVQSADLGDHDSVAAVLDVLSKRPVERIVVCEPTRRFRPKLIDLAHRTRQATGLPVIQVAVVPTQHTPNRAPWLRLWRGECPAPQPA